MSKETYVRNPDLNRKIDAQAITLMELREIYYVRPYNAFVAVKKPAPNGKKVYSYLCRFLNDSTTTIGNMHISDEYIAKNCVRMMDLETLDQVAFQYDLSISKMNYVSGAYTTNGSHDNQNTDYFNMYIRARKDPAFSLLADDPIEVDEFDFEDWPDMDERDDYNLDD